MCCGERLANHARSVCKHELQLVWALRLDKHCKRKRYCTLCACWAETQVRLNTNTQICLKVHFLYCAHPAYCTCLCDAAHLKCRAASPLSHFQLHDSERHCVAFPLWCKWACYTCLFAWASRRQGHASLASAERRCSGTSAATSCAEAGTAPGSAGSVVSTGRRLLLGALATALAARPAQVLPGPGATAKPW